jgi:hypothetical protein
VAEGLSSLETCAAVSWRSFAPISVSELICFLGEGNSIDLFFES